MASSFVPRVVGFRRRRRAAVRGGRVGAPPSDVGKRESVGRVVAESRATQKSYCINHALLEPGMAYQPACPPAWRFSLRLSFFFLSGSASTLSIVGPRGRRGRVVEERARDFGIRRSDLGFLDADSARAGEANVFILETFFIPFLLKLSFLM